MLGAWDGGAFGLASSQPGRSNACSLHVLTGGFNVELMPGPKHYMEVVKMVKRELNWLCPHTSFPSKGRETSFSINPRSAGERRSNGFELGRVDLD